MPVADSKALEFLWWSNKDLPGQPKMFKINVHPFKATQSPLCTNVALRRTPTDIYANYFSSVLKTAEKTFYVNDCLLSVEFVPRAEQVVGELCNVLRPGSFSLTKWVSSDPEVIIHLLFNIREFN